MSNVRIQRVIEKMKKKGLTQLLVSDPFSIKFLTGVNVNPGERLYALILRTNGKHTFLLNYLFFVKDTGFEEVWFGDTVDQIKITLITSTLRKHWASTKHGLQDSSSLFRRHALS